MAGKTTGHGRKAEVPAKPKPRASEMPLRPSHAGRRQRAASLHRANQMAAHEAKKQRRRALGGGKDYVR